jgi:hypothetical protein
MAGGAGVVLKVDGVEAAGWEGEVYFAGAGAGESGVAQASLEPHASMLFMAEKLDAAGAGFGAVAGVAAGCERLKALLE